MRAAEVRPAVPGVPARVGMMKVQMPPTVLIVDD
ncbi:MAG: hypothetical protein AVDCRST_MAG13-3173, partial [uncultured Solirubrobacteraceae bacterium]